ncbi:sensor histidine kinase [Alteromonas stellipolaris]|uniref:sensor histidine kinase n=1 Tax=Alteromonas stellipolaris TaxID=233316 RepID=UPI0027343ACD|nr:histidine kinase [Alteromonas stellipolaris]
MKILSFMNIERASALVTWLFVSSSALYYAFSQYGVSSHRPWLIVAVVVGIAACLSVVTRRDMPLPKWRIPLLIAMYLLAVGGLFLLPYSYLAIFLVIWSALLPYYAGWGTCLVVSVFAALPLGVIHTFYWQDPHAWLTAALFWTFNLFAMMMSNVAIKEKSAREKSEALNRQLTSTQQLIHQAGRQDERLRIARNIHDVLGHHLTALTIHLQVASHKANAAGQDEVKAHVDKCHSLAKLLLSDVREAVSDIRENAPLDWQQAVRALFKDLPRPSLQLSIADNVSIEDVSTADILLRCAQESLTNTIKHTQSAHLYVTLEKNQEGYSLTLQDEQVPTAKTIQLGNGLIGMSERIEEAGGSVKFSFNKHGFSTHILLPEPL